MYEIKTEDVYKNFNSNTEMFDFINYSTKSKHTGSLMYEIETEDVYKDFNDNTEMFDFINYSTKSKYCDNSIKLVVCKMKNETAGFAIEEFVRLKPKMYSNLVNDNGEHKKEKSINKNVVATISYNEYRDVLLNKKCLRHSMNRIHRTGTYEMNKISLPCFDDKIYIPNIGCGGLALCY